MEKNLGISKHCAAISTQYYYHLNEFGERLVLSSVPFGFPAPLLNDDLSDAMFGGGIVGWMLEFIPAFIGCGGITLPIGFIPIMPVLRAAGFN